jgi:uncharacterized protein YndB with AHSA1/START domain
MTVIAVRKDAQSRTMTLEAEFDASPERVWQLWADPRQIERWWGPPTYPARQAMTAVSFADGIANLVAEADPALELRESIEVGVKWAQTPDSGR